MIKSGIFLTIYSKLNKSLKIIDNCKNNGLLLVNCGLEGNVIRFMGPLTTPLDQVEEALDIFNKSVINI